MAKIELVNGEIYHIFNRGVEKRNIYMEDSDYFRFARCLYECNDRNYVIIRDRIHKRQERKNHIGETYVIQENSKRELLVEILAFTLMPNHYHLIVRQLVDNGISLFMGKLSNSHTGYFNKKYNRKGMGALFQGAFKAVRVESDSQFMDLLVYIFTNPVGIMEPQWKERGANDPMGAIQYLNNYFWSSYLDTIGGKSFPSITDRDSIYKIFGSIEKVKEYTEGWIKNKSDFRTGVSRIADIAIDSKHT